MFCFFFLSLPKVHWKTIIDAFARAKRGNFFEYVNHLLTADTDLVGLLKFTEETLNRYKNYNILQEQHAKAIYEQLLQKVNKKIKIEKILERLQIYSELFAIPSFATNKISEEIDAEIEIVKQLIEESQHNIDAFLKHCKVFKFIPFLKMFNSFYK